MTHTPMPQPNDPNQSQATSASGSLPWMLILLLGALALIRPLMHLTGIIGGVLPSGGLTVITVTILITAAWVMAVVAAGVDRPFLALVLAGLTYAVLSMVLSAILSPILLGELQGPLANPIAIPDVLATNAIWGGIAGGIAAGVRQLRRDR